MCRIVVRPGDPQHQAVAIDSTSADGTRRVPATFRRPRRERLRRSEVRRLAPVVGPACRVGPQGGGEISVHTASRPAGETYRPENIAAHRAGSVNKLPHARNSELCIGPSTQRPEKSAMCAPIKSPWLVSTCEKRLPPNSQLCIGPRNGWFPAHNVNARSIRTCGCPRTTAKIARPGVVRTMHEGR